ncbi:MAG TPA: Flp family type IVb pilin [Chloroflexia bacterium]|nr:Flp family type IVb pilin [Chloroflexia bacterium]
MNAARPRERWYRRRWRVDGQGLVEYALILVMIAIVIILILTFIGQVVATNMYSKINSGFPGG